MNFNLVEMYNGLLRFNKHILNELAEGLKHLLTEFNFRFGPYFIPNKVGTNKKPDYNWIRGNDGQDTDKAACVLLLSGRALDGSGADSGIFGSHWVRSDSGADVGFFTTVKLD